MKSKSTLRSFLAMAGSSLLAVSTVSAGTYYWDSDGDGTAGFGTTAGTWQTTDPTTNKWSTSPTGDGIGGAAVADYLTTTSDDIFFGTATVNYTGNTTINGTVKAKSILQSNSHNGFTAGTTPVIEFGATGSFETLKTANTLPILTVTGAGTSLTWISSRNMSIGSITVNIITTSKTILQTSATAINTYPSRVAMTSASNLGAVGAGLEFNGATLRISTGFPYTSLSALNTDHPVNFVLNKNSGLDNSAGGTTFTVDQAIDLGTGKFYAEAGGTGSILKLTQANIWAGTYITSGSLEISDSSQLGAITSPFTFGSGNSAELSSGNLRIAGTSMTSLGARPLVTTPTKSVGFDIVAAANTFTVDKELDQTTGTFTKAGLGTLVLIQDNTFTGASTLTGGGTLVLDYTSVSENGSRLSDTAALTLTNSDLTLKNGSHPETVLSTALSAGHSHIAQDGGSSSINLNAVTRAAGGTTSFSAASIATTDTNNFGTSGANNILGGWATIGDDWAVSANTGAANTAITALASYTPYVTTGGVGTANYLLNGPGSVTSATNLVGSLKITNSANSEVLALGANNLSIQSASATALGGIMYAGGNDNLYSITGTGRIVPSTANQELIFAVNTGTLTVDCFVGSASNSSPLTKSGAGKLVLTNSVVSTGATRVNQGTLLVNNTSGNGISGGAVTVFNKAKIGGTGTIGGSTTINDGGGLTFDIITAAGSHNSLDLAATKILAFPTASSGGNSTVTITSTGGTPGTGIYTLVTAPGGITGTLPSVVLPLGWTTGAPYIDGTSLKINITFAAYAGWKGANAGGQNPDLDFDNDGVDNGVEYFMNAVAGFTANPALDGTNTITWPNGGNILPAAYGTEYVIQTSSDLVGWLDVPVGDLTTNTAGPGGSLTYTLTGAAPRFVRLKVTPN